MNDVEPTKRCPLCHDDLSVDDFGLCRARKDGRNLYCKRCIRRKVRSQRVSLKIYKANRNLRDREVFDHEIERKSTRPTTYRKREPQRDENGILLRSEIYRNRATHSDRVLAAIHHGGRTQKQIRSLCETLTEEEIGIALATLMFSTPRKIVALRHGDETIYAPSQNHPAVAGGGHAGGREVGTSLSFATLGGVVRPVMRGERRLRSA